MLTKLNTAKGKITSLKEGMIDDYITFSQGEIVTAPMLYIYLPLSPFLLMTSSSPITKKILLNRKRVYLKNTSGNKMHLVKNPL